MIPNVSTSPARWFAAGVLSVALAGATLASARTLPDGLALEVSLGSAAKTLVAASEEPSGQAAQPSVALRVVVPWTAAAARPAQLAALEELLAACAGGAVRVILVLDGPGPAGTGVELAGSGDAALDAWLAFVTQVVTVSQGRVAAYVVWDGANLPERWGRAPSVKDYAFLLKRTSVAIHAVDDAALVAQGALRASPTFQRELLEAGVAPFLDAYGVDLFDTEAPERTLELCARVVSAFAPGAPLWVRGPERVLRGSDALWALAVAARATPASLTSYGVSEADAARLRRVLRAYARSFPAGAGPAVSTGRALVTFPAEARLQHAVHVVPSDLSTRLAYRWDPSAGARPRSATAVLARLRAPEAEHFRVIDPQADAPVPLTPDSAAGGAAGYRVQIPLPEDGRWLVLAFDQPQLDERAGESVGVTGEAVVTVEQVLARHLEVQAGRDRRLRHFSADLTTEMWYQLGASGRAVEVRVEGTYHQDERGVREVENRRFYINGAPYDPDKRPPEIPLLQPEKVTVVPLDVHLDRTYAYTLLGRGSWRGRPTWRVAFRPLEVDATRVSGVATIDAQTYDRLRVEAVQGHLEPPILSSEQVDAYLPVQAQDGSEHWLIAESDIQRTVSILGASVVVRTRMTFAHHRINEESFGAQLEAAHASEHQMLRETELGLEYLRRQPDGSRVPGPASTKKVLLAFGARFDGSYDGLVPLAGVNWLDYDLRGTGLQLNVFAAGAINTLSLADPSLCGRRLEGSFDVFLPFVSRRDRLRLPGGGIDDGSVVKSRAPSVELGLGVPVGRFGKIALLAELEHATWTEDDDTASGWEAPSDGFVGSLSVRGEYHRRGWDARVRLERAHRFEWDAWGPDGGTSAPEYFEAGDEDYWTWRAGVARRWFLPRSQALSVGLDAFGGSGLDRFSQFEFQGFGGPNLAGFDGSGIHFDRAILARLGYGFDVGGVLGLELSVEAARVRNGELPETVVDEFGEWSDAIGVGLEGTLPGPWGTIVSFDVGYAARASDHEGAEGDVVAQVVFYKLLR